MEKVKRIIPEAQRITKRFEDVQKSRFSHQDWRVASEPTSTHLEQQLKEPQHLLFFQRCDL